MGIRHRFAGPECILELRARIEALEEDSTEQAESNRFCTDAIVARIEAMEAAQQPAPVAEESSATAPPAPDDRLRWCPSHGQQPRNAWGCPECVRELRAAAAPPAPAGGLVEMVGSQIPLLPNGRIDDAIARTVIYVIAAWLRSEPWVGRAAADRLDQEANR